MPRAHSTSSYRDITINNSPQTRKLLQSLHKVTTHNKTGTGARLKDQDKVQPLPVEKVFIAVANSHTPKQGENPAHIESYDAIIV